MTCSVIRVTEDLKRHAGHAVITVSVVDLPNLPGSIEFSIRRSGQIENILGESTWQGADNWFSPEEAWYTNNGQYLQFVFRSDAIFELQNMPYDLFLRGKGMEDSVAIPLYWPDILQREVETTGERRPMGEGPNIRKPSGISPQNTDDKDAAGAQKKQEAELEEIIIVDLPPAGYMAESETKALEPKPRRPSDLSAPEPKPRRRSDFFKLIVLVGLISAFLIAAVSAGYVLLRDKSGASSDPTVQPAVRERQESPQIPVSEQQERTAAEKSMPGDEPTEEENVDDPVSDSHPADRQHETQEPGLERNTAPAPPSDQTSPGRDGSPGSESDLESDLESELRKELEKGKDSTIEFDFEDLLNQNK